MNTPPDTLAAMLTAAGVTLDDLDAIAQHLQPSPRLTLDDYRDHALDVLAATKAASTATSWRPHIQRLCDPNTGLGAHTLTAVNAIQIETLATKVRREAASRPRGRTGKGAHEHFINAARFIFKTATAEGHTTTNPALAVRHLPRDNTKRRALTPDEIADIWNVAIYKTKDPELFGLLLDFHLETAARREGALTLSWKRLLRHNRRVTLIEKGGKTRTMPLSARLTDRIVEHATSRSVTQPEDRVFRQANGHPITRNTYQKLYDTIDAYLPWAAEIDFGVHHLRHTTGTHIERIAGIAVSAHYLGHAESQLGTTGTYTKATDADIDAAHAVLFRPEDIDPRAITPLEAKTLGPDALGIEQPRSKNGGAVGGGDHDEVTCNARKVPARQLDAFDVDTTSSRGDTPPTVNETTDLET